jgi:hypothetical protein
MGPTTSNLQIRTPAGHGVDSESEVPVSHNTQTAQTSTGQRKCVKMHEPNVVQFLDIEVEVSEEETGSSGGVSNSDSDDDLGKALCY